MRFLILSLLCLVFLSLTSKIFAQILLEENFDYEPGKLSSASELWIDQVDGSYDIQVVTGNLSFADYTSSGIGNMIELNGGASGRSGIVTGFTPISGDGNKIYASFLLNVTSDDDLDLEISNGCYFAVFKTSGAMRNYIYIKKGSVGKYKLGIAKSSSTSLTYNSSAEYDLNTTYLIVICYVFQSGDDLCRLWVNPSLGGSEPVPDAEISSGSDADLIQGFQFRQESKSGDMEIDGLRIGQSWESVPLPVELSSFSAEQKDNKIVLRWRTETEVNNYGFEIERKSPLTESWETIGFVFGSGNSNSPIEYYYIDEHAALPGTYSYKLKQIDFDGSFEYSFQVSVSRAVEENYWVAQNYPNPFNPSTTITFGLPQGSIINITLYNITGEEVLSLANGFYQAGKHEIIFHAEDISAGVYFYTFAAKSYFEVRKMLLLK